MGEREGDALKDFWIWELNQQRQVTLFMRAASGTLQFDEASLALVLTLNDGNAEQRNPDRPEAFSEDFGQSLFFEELSIALPLERILNPGSQRRRLKEMTFDELQALRNQLIADEQAGMIETPRPGAPSEQRLRVQMQIQNHFAMAFSVFSLAVLAIPLAIQIGRKETYANITLALVLAITYYFLMIVISWLEAQPALRADLLLWLPNIAFQALGAYGLYRASQR
jgi:lipopolysaccharide export system permease protein